MRKRSERLRFASPTAAPSPEGKAADRKAFMSDWIAFGMHLKNRADAHDVKWQGKAFETWMAEIIFREEWAKPEGVKRYG